MQNKLLLNNIQAFILLINIFVLVVLYVKYLNIDVQNVLDFVVYQDKKWIKSGQSLNFWLKYQIFF